MYVSIAKQEASNLFSAATQMQSFVNAATVTPVNANIPKPLYPLPSLGIILHSSH
jgi:hypothetical protein